MTEDKPAGTEGPSTNMGMEPEKKWWNKLTAKARKAIWRKMARSVEKKQNKIILLTKVVQGYCCPKCHTWHPTPEARKACRQGHKEAV